VGRLLFILVQSMKARRVLELGSGYGYSALWFARALPGNGEVHLTDWSEENLRSARRYLDRAGLLAKARFHHGNALAIIDRVKGPFDIVFNDIDKEHYPVVVDKAFRVLRPGGLLISDNALWEGKVHRKRVDATTRGVQEYNQRVFAHPRLQTVILSLRDGLSLSLKLRD
jgi:predicted O-methyltransferase YrrM